MCDCATLQLPLVQVQSVRDMQGGHTTVTTVAADATVTALATTISANTSVATSTSAAASAAAVATFSADRDAARSADVAWCRMQPVHVHLTRQ